MNYEPMLVTPEISTREALSNWMQPGVLVRCIKPDFVGQAITEHVAQGYIAIEALTLDLTIPHRIASISHADNNPNWKYMRFEDYDTFSIAPELSDGTVLWEPVE